MPIRPENKKRYPKDWAEISKRIRFERAGGRCEQVVQRVHPVTMAPLPPIRCEAINGEPHPITGSKVVLTVAHLNHTPEDCRDENLKAMCQRCHLTLDAKLHHTNRVRCDQTPDMLSGKKGSPHDWRD